MSSGHHATELHVLPWKPSTQIEWLSTAVGVVFAICLWMVDWQTLRGMPFSDLQNYIYNFHQRAYIVSSDVMSVAQWYSQEYLWRSGIYALTEYLPLESIFSYITLASLVVMSIFVVVKSGSSWYLLLLVHPQFIDLCFSQVRSAAAMSLVYLAILIPSRIIGLVLVVAAPFVHSAILVYSGAYGISWGVVEIDKLRKRRLLVICAYVVLCSLIFTVLRPVILDLLGDRRAALPSVTGGVLLTAMLGTYALPFVFFRAMFSWNFEALLVVLGSTLCVALFIEEQNGLRFVALVIPALAVAIAKIPHSSWRALIFVAALIFQAAYFVYWVNG